MNNSKFHELSADQKQSFFSFFVQLSDGDFFFGEGGSFFIAESLG